MLYFNDANTKTKAFCVILSKNVKKINSYAYYCCKKLFLIIYCTFDNK